MSTDIDSMARGNDESLADVSRRLQEAEEALQIAVIHRDQYRHREDERSRQLAEAIALGAARATQLEEMTRELAARQAEHAANAARQAAIAASLSAAVAERQELVQILLALESEMARLQVERDSLLRAQAARLEAEAAETAALASRLGVLADCLDGTLEERAAALGTLRGGEPPAVPAFAFADDTDVVRAETVADAVTETVAPVAEVAHLPVTAFVALPHLSILFDHAFYLALYPDVAAAGVDPFEHFCAAGRFDGRSPHPLFDVAHYRAQLSHGSQVADVLAHYLTEGRARGLNPCPQFDAEWYVATHGLADDTSLADDMRIAPLLHYLTEGAARGLAPSSRFDVARYVANRPEVDFADVSPLAHYCAGLRAAGAATAAMGPIWSEADYARQLPLLEAMAQVRHTEVAGRPMGVAV